jgi:hypothetical protein
MGCEFLIKLDDDSCDVTNQQLEDILKILPNYSGRVQYPDNEAFELRSKTNLNGMPDVYVIGKNREIWICQNGDYLILLQALGALVVEFVTESKSECIKVLKP